MTGSVFFYYSNNNDGMFLNEYDSLIYIQRGLQGVYAKEKIKENSLIVVSNLEMFFY
jgi:hypothetical protein